MSVLHDVRKYRKATFICMVATLGAIAFGYDGSYFSGVLVMPPFVKAYGEYDRATGSYTIPAWLMSLITSIINLGELLGALSSHFVGTKVGRRGGIVAGCCTVLAGTLIHAIAPKVAVLVIGRLLLGVGVAYLAAFVPLYIADCAPATLRGALTGAWQFSLGIGLIIGTATVYGTKDRTDSGSYLIPMTVQAIMPLFLIAACVLILPESPRWLISKGSTDKARAALVRLAGNANVDEVDSELAFITNAVEETRHESNGSWKELVKPGPESRKLMISVGMAAWNQAGGINFVVSYGAVILNSFGTIDPYVGNLSLFCAALPFILFSQYLFERVGRRKAIMCSMAGIGAINVIDGGLGLGPKTHAIDNAAVAMFYLFYFIFNLGIGGGAWVSIAEINTGRNRSRLVGLSTAAVWLFAWLVSFTFPYLYNSDAANLGSKIGFIYGALMAVGVVWVYFLLPETVGRSLEEIDQMFALHVPARQFSSFVCPCSQTAVETKDIIESKLPVVERIEKLV